MPQLKIPYATPKTQHSQIFFLKNSDLESHLFFRVWEWDSGPVIIYQTSSVMLKVYIDNFLNALQPPQPMILTLQTKNSSASDRHTHLTHSVASATPGQPAQLLQPSYSPRPHLPRPLFLLSPTGVRSAPLSPCEEKVKTPSPFLRTNFTLS